MEVFKIGKNKLSGRESAKRFTLNWIRENEQLINESNEIVVDFDHIENVNQSFMNELLRNIIESFPNIEVFQKNCMHSHITQRFDVELQRVKDIYKS